MPAYTKSDSKHRPSIRSISQWELLLDKVPANLACEWIMRDLAGYRLMGPRNYLPRDVIQLQNALSAWRSIAAKGGVS